MRVYKLGSNTISKVGAKLRLGVNFTKIDFENTLGVLHFGKQLLKSLRTYHGFEIVALFDKEPSQNDLFDLLGIESVNCRDRKPAISVEILLHHFQMPLTSRSPIMIVHDLHVWDVPWKYANPDAVKKAMINSISKVKAVLTEFPRTYFDLPKVIPRLTNSFFLTVSPTLLDITDVPADEVETMRRSWNSRAGDRVIIYPAQVQPHKNHFNLFKAVKILLEKGYPVRLVCTGSDFSSADALIEAVEELGIAQSVVLPGHLSDREMVAAFKAADMVISPSLAEGGAYVAQEAIVYGKAVVVSNIRSARLHLERMRASVPYFDPCAPKDMAAAIIDALTKNPNHDVAQQVIARWTWERLSDQYASVIYWLAKGAPAGEMPFPLP